MLAVGRGPVVGAPLACPSGVLLWRAPLHPESKQHYSLLLHASASTRMPAAGEALSPSLRFLLHPCYYARRRYVHPMCPW